MVISNTGEPLVLTCDRCGCQYPELHFTSSLDLRWDAQIRGWQYLAIPSSSRFARHEDVCPPCIGTAPWDADEVLAIEREMKAREQ